MSNPDKKIRDYIHQDIKEMLELYIDKLHNNTGIDVKMKYKMSISIPLEFLTELEESGINKSTRYIGFAIDGDLIKGN